MGDALWGTLSVARAGAVRGLHRRRACLAEFEARYNERRPHWALVPQGGGDPVTPLEVYEGKVRPQLPRWQAWAREAKAKLDALRERPAA